MVDENGFYQDVHGSLPKDFFSKSFNEPFVQDLMSKALGMDNWIKGNPDKFEPDYFCNGKPFEITLVSDSKKKNSFIRRLQQGLYTSDDCEADLLKYLDDRLTVKARKQYSAEGVHLCLLCVTEMFIWVADEYGSQLAFIFNSRRDKYFKKIKNEYIDTGVFANVFVIFPDLFAKWWVYDVLSNVKCGIRGDISDSNYPFFIDKNLYAKMIEENLIAGETI